MNKNPKAAFIVTMSSLFLLAAFIAFSAPHDNTVDAADACLSEQHGEFVIDVGGRDTKIGEYHRQLVEFEQPFCSAPIVVLTPKVGDAELAVVRLSVQSELADAMVVSVKIDPTMVGPDGEIRIGWMGRSAP